MNDHLGNWSIHAIKTTFENFQTIFLVFPSVKKKMAEVALALNESGNSAAEATELEQGAEQDQIRIATFDVDATPPVGSMMAYDRVIPIVDATARLLSAALDTRRT